MIAGWLASALVAATLVSSAPSAGTGLVVRARPDGGVDVVLHGRVVDTTHSHAPRVYPGQVTSRYAVWALGVDGAYRVRRYDARTRRTVEVPGSTYQRQQYAPAVGAGGVVYYARSSPACGGATIQRWPGGARLARLDRHADVVSSVVSGGALYLRLARCDGSARSIVRLRLATTLRVGPTRTLKQIRDAIARARPGATILVDRGTYLGFDIAGKNGLTIRAPGRDAVVTPTTDRDDNRDTILVTGSSRVVLDGLRSFRANRAAIRIDHSNRVRILNGVYGDNRTWGIFTDFSDDVDVEYCDVYGSKEQHGIYFSNSGDRPVAMFNRIHANAANGIHLNGDASEGGDGIISGATLSNNRIWANGRLGGGGIDMDGVQGSVISRNVIWQAHGAGITAYRTDAAAGPKDDTIERNVVDVARDGKYAIEISQAAGRVSVVRNTIANRNPAHGAISFDAPASAARTVSDGNTFAGAVFFSTDDWASRFGLARWRAQGHDRHSRVVPLARVSP